MTEQSTRTLDRTVRPYREMVTVTEAPNPTEESGLYIPASALDQYERGIIQEVGPGVDKLEPGMLIYYPRGHHQEIGHVRIVDHNRVFAYEDA